MSVSFCFNLEYKSKMRFLLSIFIFLFFQNLLAVQIFRTGSTLNALTQPEFLVCLAGGGNDDEWADGWRALLKAAHSGDVVIIRADGQRGGYEPWIYFDQGQHQFPHINSITTLLLESKEDSKNSEIINHVENAEVIFFAGGDQTLYVDWIRNSPLSIALKRKLFSGSAAFGGTSAGMAYLSAITYTGRYSSPQDSDSNVTAEDVLKNPLAPYVDLTLSMIRLPFFQDIVTETHFTARNRQGRIIGFMAKAFQTGLSKSIETTKGIAADEGTAFCFNKSGIGKVFGTGQVYFLHAQQEPEQIEMDKPLIWNQLEKAVLVNILPGSIRNSFFNLNSWTATDGFQEYWSVNTDTSGEPKLKIISIPQ